MTYKARDGYHCKFHTGKLISHSDLIAQIEGIT